MARRVSCRMVPQRVEESEIGEACSNIEVPGMSWTMAIDDSVKSGEVSAIHRHLAMAVEVQGDVICSQRCTADTVPSATQ